MEFTLKAIFDTSSKHLYSTWMSSKGHSAMTGGEAIIGDQIGDEFTAWDDYIHGKNIVLEPYTRIIQSWRTLDFQASEADSRIEIQLQEVDGQTELTLIHSNLPPHGDQYITGWDIHYFQPMKAYFQHQ